MPGRLLRGLSAGFQGFPSVGGSFDVLQLALLVSLHRTRYGCEDSCSGSRRLAHRADSLGRPCGLPVVPCLLRCVHLHLHRLILNVCLQMPRLTLHLHVSRLPLHLHVHRRRDNLRPLHRGAARLHGDHLQL